MSLEKNQTRTPLMATHYSQARIQYLHYL